MALLGQTQLGLAALILTALLSLSLTGEGLKQELWLYTEDGDELHFDSHVPDLTSYSTIIPKITNYCVNGSFAIYSDVNYQKGIYITGLSSGRYHCTTFNISTAKSLRYWAASETSTDAISLYTGSNYDAEGEEVYVNGTSRTHIEHPIGFVAATGSSDWMLFEGIQLDGKSSCLWVPDNHNPGWAFGADIVSHLNMSTVGSVFKGCDEKEIQLYRESNLM